MAVERQTESMAHRSSLLTAVDSRGHVHLVVGANPLAASRCNQSLAVGAVPVLIAPEPAKQQHQPPSPSLPEGLLPGALQVLVDSGAVRWIRESLEERHLFGLGRPEVNSVVDAVFVTEGGAVSGAGAQSAEKKAAHISAVCRRHRIPVNVVDAPELCSFALLSTHSDGPLQVGITTNGSGCKLAARIRREVAAALPPGLGNACARLGGLRRQIQAEDEGKWIQEKADVQEKAERIHASHGESNPVYDEDTFDQRPTFNRLVLEADASAAKTRRMRWLSQMCEYWPLKRLASVTDADMEALLQQYRRGAAMAGIGSSQTGASHSDTPGRIILAGSGPGHPDLLTRAVHQAILSADLVLADKLVPQGVLDLIPRHTEVRIARKFPGNADAAQEELMEAATAAARAGRVVLRLKQGDPFIYGRGGEEVLRLRQAGLSDITVLPGVTSALSAPLFAGIPATHRDVADQVLICTGTGKKGRPPQPPGYRASRTAVFLMGLHRIEGLVAELTEYTAGEAAEGEAAAGKATTYRRQLWPATTPCAVIERASCPDQKVIRTTLAHVVEAIEQEGSRPPGLLVVGRACEVLYPGVGSTASAAAETTETACKPWTVEDGFAGFRLNDAMQDWTA